MTLPEPSIRVNVDPTNPGQFFACCGLLELADRLWPGAEGWFADDGREFRIACGGELKTLIRTIANAELDLVDTDDIYSGRARLHVGKPPLLLDWWHERGGKKDAKDLKVWAGTMESHGIAKAMQMALREPVFESPDLFGVGRIVLDSDGKKKEPYYYDSRRAPNAHSRDVGFAPNDLSLTTTAYPAVEFLCLVGLQRCLPVRGEGRLYDYFTWPGRASPELLPALVAGHVRSSGSLGYRFENWFRTGQKKHKAFRSAIPLAPGA